MTLLPLFEEVAFMDSAVESDFLETNLHNFGMSLSREVIKQTPIWESANLVAWDESSNCVGCIYLDTFPSCQQVHGNSLLLCWQIYLHLKESSCSYSTMNSVLFLAGALLFDTSGQAVTRSVTANTLGKAIFSQW